MWTVTVTLAVRPDITGSLMDITSIFPPSWEAVMLTFTTDEAMVMVEEGLDVVSSIVDTEGTV